MTSQQQDLISKAQESLNAAKLLKANHYFEYAVSRAYYAMFYIAEAFLEGENKQFSSHAAVISAFGRDFANLGKVPQDFHRTLIDAQTLRQISDYGKFNVFQNNKLINKLSTLNDLLTMQLIN
jgi:uncharacterized protein (UPF0332 family)